MSWDIAVANVYMCYIYIYTASGDNEYAGQLEVSHAKLQVLTVMHLLLPSLSEDRMRWGFDYSQIQMPHFWGMVS